jgi:hypothetical protein
VSYSNALQGFKQKYTATDIALLAKIDKWYDMPSAAVVKKLCERAFSVFEETEYENIAHISVSHLHNTEALQTARNSEEL